MGDLMYATIVILIIWGGIFLYLNRLNRRMKRLEQLRSTEAPAEGSTVVSSGESPPGNAADSSSQTAEPSGGTDGSASDSVATG